MSALSREQIVDAHLRSRELECLGIAALTGILRDHPGPWHPGPLLDKAYAAAADLPRSAIDAGYTALCADRDLLTVADFAVMYSPRPS